ncbi:MAG: hypothetical protein L0219_21995 [Phycisphaerales bacterium]|nr:hypothetical protein [Phycisphaerales bacterium]
MDEQTLELFESDLPLVPRCLRCAYVLQNLTESRCPECGREFDLDNPSTYTLKPPFLAWKFWLPGLSLAIIGGIAGAALMLEAGNWGWPLWFGVPFAAGSLLGYRLRCKWFIIAVMILTTVVSMCVGMMAMQVAGIYCGIALVGIFLGPLFIGTVLGTILRLILKRTPFNQKWYLPALAIFALPLICGWLEGSPRRSAPIESISTVSIIDAPAARCWDSIMFYEEVKHSPPLILRIGLAHPLYTTGSSRSPGDVKTCIYNKGRITKKITAVDPQRQLAFDVIEQRIGYERDVRLTGGSFKFSEVDSTTTQVTLTTQYEPLLHPRWAWRPFERFAVHTLHEHVIEGMRRQAVEDQAIATDHWQNAQVHRD